MSNSRLEKFIYAICGMDIDDLPTPLSRIETLWNCLITGEVPDFEPLSRNEKYLMAMLNDNVDELPEPTSRSEKLLYKIATGETDLSDVPGYLSRYEELLKQLIENGGIGGTDFEYVLYTLNQPLSTLYTTAEGPVKSAILKGNTLLVDELGNECEIPNSPKITLGAWINTVTGVETASVTSFNTGFLKCPTVTFIVKGNNKYKRIVFYDKNKKFISGIDKQVGDNSNITINSTQIPSNAFYLRISASINTDGVSYTPDTKLLIEDVSGNNLYSTQLVSVKMPVLTTTGKNLFDVNKGKEFVYNRVPFTKFDGSVYTIRVDSVDSVEIENDSIILNNITYANTVQLQTKHYVDEGVTYNISIINESGTSIRVRGITYYNQYGEILGGYWDRIGEITPPKGCNYLIVGYTCGLGNGRYKIQFEQGSTATTYEPHKTNILTTTSKNLFNMNRPYDVITDSQATVVQDTNQITVSSSAESGIYVNVNFILDKDFFAGKTVTGSCLYESDENDIGTVQITYQDGDGEYHYQWIRTPKTFTFPNSFIGDVMLSVSANNTGTPQSNTVTVKNIQLELGSTATPYEPYSEVVLRGIGDVKDELNVVNGELTQRIKEVVFDGSEDWIRSADFSNLTNTVHFQIQSDTVGIEWASPLISDKFINQRIWAIDLEGVNCATNGNLAISINRDRLSGLEVADFKKWLSQNNVTVVGKSEESIKTVVLSTLDQDGQPTKLSTFDDITHVSIDAEDLLPTIDLEVATKIEETLSSLPTQMIDISEKQQSLNEKIDEQAKNIKEVSTAMIEIRNDIL